MEESLVEIGFGNGSGQEVVKEVWNLTEQISCYNLEVLSSLLTRLRIMG